jgi:predicted AlkP superfamily pyrophosphatase or phosphodiesterase
LIGINHVYAGFKVYKKFNFINNMAPKVILLSLDGATDAIVDKYLANGVLDPKTGLGLLKSKGVAATDNETITPSITAPSHIAIATGSTAAKPRPS